MSFTDKLKLGFDKWDRLLKEYGLFNPINPFDHSTSTDTKLQTLTLEFVIEQSRQTYESAISFLEANKEEISNLYPNAYFEILLNIKTKNQCSLTNDEVIVLYSDMEYFLTKENRYTSDSAIVVNFLLGKRGERAPDELKTKLEEYIYKDNTSFGFVYCMLNNKSDLETKYSKLLKMFVNITNPLDKEKLDVYINELPEYNSLEDDNVIIERLKNLTL